MALTSKECDPHELVACPRTLGSMHFNVVINLKHKCCVVWTLWAPNKNLLKMQISVKNANKPRDKAIEMIKVLIFYSLQSFKIKSDGFHTFLAKKEIQIDGF